MLSKELINKIKAAIVAIGLVDKGSVNPKIIIGSGFLFDPAGYVMTAGHVAEKCKELGDMYNKKNEPVECVVFRSIISKKLTFTVDVIEKFSVMDLVKLPKDYVGPTDLDIACGKPVTKHSDFPHLTIKSTCEYNLFDDVFMCGYPRGNHSLSLSAKKITGMRFSPILQSGKIVGMLPWDGDQTPYALQTDIIGTGGSSGSPIVNCEGEVVAVAQKVIPSAVFDLNEKDPNPIGDGQIGITYGATSCVFTNFVNSTKKYYDTGIDSGPVAVPLTTLTFAEFTKA
ncbi:MAG: serine protease [Candidatus Nitrosotenuis sp.]